ncbi:ligase-associated DNA damage response exonuclease [Chelatococcus sp. SYSU_G07232]|uniref:Ligase-associated DNA damage response exonuclease n=1 Tax=Chelatococcus albus TaxID=3047466 RepID=A0ABT7AF71_9HYPH|nr:ligase-associated DNA damage response exonuclease [Chelatococcus sp. SYSU_G07232]MDJ1157988.1 ligase-associated DNA damage response exonuclease [Chelatococcus sp. SYSU_G07232]
MRPADILTLTPAGLFCPPGDFHVDPVRPVARALITHGHSDHARAGHGAVLATAETLGIMGVRYGEAFAGSTQIATYGEPIALGPVRVTFVPAGHVLGSAQIIIEAGPTRIVVSGDYKRAPDPTCRAFEPVSCDVFITEATFGLPVFRHPAPGAEIAKLLQSVALFPEQAHLVGAYPLGKAQRLIALIRETGYERPIYVHGAMERLTDYYVAQSVQLGDIRLVRAEGRAALGGAIVICPPGALQDLWARRFPDPVAAFASGWMRVRARARQRGVELPLVVSDHADWDDLCTTIVETGAEEVWVTHGQEDALVHWCLLNGIKARPLHMLGYGDEDATEAPPAASGQAGGLDSTPAVQVATGRVPGPGRPREGEPSP